MANIFGTTTLQNIDQTFNTIRESLLINNDKLTQTEKYQNNCIAISQISLKEYILTPHTTKNLAVYFYGSIYNFTELKKDFNLQAETPLEAIAETYLSNRLELFLNKTNGKFNGCIYNENNKTITLFVDRFGTHFFYYCHSNKTFTFASYLQTLLLFRNLNLETDKNAILNYYECGSFVENNTWFEHIKVINPASILEYNIESDTLTSKYYWKFSEIKPQKISYKEAVNQLANLFTTIVQRRLNQNKKIAVPISGGRDSRMIVAAINKINPNFKTYNYTFGIKNCGDIVISEEVCNTAKQKHHIFYFNSNEKDITVSRYNALLQSGIPLHSLHGSEFSDMLSDCSELIHGYPGGEIFTTIINLRPQFLNQKFSIKILNSLFPDFHGELKQIEDDYYDIPHYDAYYLTNFLRRFGAHNLFLLEMKIKTHCPYLDNDIINLIFSLPDEYRLRGLFSDALVKAFPEFYKIIPWQQIAYPCWLIKRDKKYYDSPMAYWRDKLIRKINKIYFDNKYRSKFPKKNKEYFFDYTGNLKNPTLQPKYSKILNPQTAEYSKYTTENFYEKYYIPLLEGKTDDYFKLFNIISAELFLSHINSTYQ